MGTKTESLRCVFLASSSLGDSFGAALRPVHLCDNYVSQLVILPIHACGSKLQSREKALPEMVSSCAKLSLKN